MKEEIIQEPKSKVRREQEERVARAQECGISLLEEAQQRRAGIDKNIQELNTRKVELTERIAELDAAKNPMTSTVSEIKAVGAASQELRAELAAVDRRLTVLKEQLNEAAKAVLEIEGKARLVRRTFHMLTKTNLRLAHLQKVSEIKEQIAKLQETKTQLEAVYSAKIQTAVDEYKTLVGEDVRKLPELPPEAETVVGYTNTHGRPRSRA